MAGQAPLMTVHLDLELVLRKIWPFYDTKTSTAYKQTPAFVHFWSSSGR